MSLADELRQQSKENDAKYQEFKEKMLQEAAKAQREAEELKRKKELEWENAINDWTVANDIYEYFMASIKAHMENNGKIVGHPEVSQRLFCECIYKASEFRTEQEEIYKRSEEGRFSSDQEKRAAERQNERAHRAFTFDECNTIETQLSKRLKEDGFTFAFNRSAAGQEGLFLVKVDIKWFDWDSSKQVSNKAIKEIKNKCAEFIKVQSRLKPTSKLSANIGLAEKDIFLGYDGSIFFAKMGFAIATNGITYISLNTKYHVPFNKLADITIWCNEDGVHLAQDSRNVMPIPSLSDKERKMFLEFLLDIQQTIRADLS